MKKNLNSDHSMAHVLYQKLGTDWYAFTELDGEMFMGKLDENSLPREVAEAERNKLSFAAPKELKAA